MYDKLSFEISTSRKKPKILLFVSVVIVIVVFFIALVILISPSPYINSKIGIGGGGSFYTPMIDPTNDNNIYTTSDKGGFYYSHNKGKTWERINNKGVFNVAHITNNGTLFLGGYGLYASYDKGKTIELIYPKKIIYQISRCGWNENLILGDHYNYTHLKTVSSYANKIYFITLDSNFQFRLMESDFGGNNFRILHEENYSSNPINNNNIISLADESGFYYSMETYINFYNSTNSTIQKIYTAEGSIKDFQKINEHYFIIDDTSNKSKILYSVDFVEFKDLQEYNNLSNEFYYDDKKGSFNWHFIQLSGSNFNNIFLSLRSTVNEFDDIVEGILKFNKAEFEWVFSNKNKTIHSLNLTGWSYGIHGPINGIYASKSNQNECLVSNAETVYIMEYQTETTKQIDNLHANKSGNDYYITRGLDVQTTYWVREDPFNSKHIIIASSDMGIQISYDDSKTWRRMELNETDSRIYNTCYDLYFDTENKNVVYGLWSSRHDAPYYPSYEDKDTIIGKFAISTDGGINWNFNYSNGIPNDAIPIKMSVKKTTNALVFVVAAFNRGFYISYDSGKTFTSINEGMDQIKGMIFGEDVIIIDDIVYCLTAPIPPSGNVDWKPSKLYKYSLNIKTIESIDLEKIIIARSITYHPTLGLLINVIPTYRTEWNAELNVWKYYNENGGIYVYNGEKVSKFFENDEGIFNCGVMSNGEIYAVDTYGKIFEYKKSKWKVLYDGLFTMLKNVSFSKNGKLMYVTSFGGGTYKFGL